MNINIWLDGICKKCGSLIIEKSSDKLHADYMNACLNSQCEEHKWHYVYDTDKLDYYEHDTSIDKKIIIKR